MQEYYYISANGEQVGPVKGEDLLSHGISPKTMVWGRDMSGWATADSVPEIVALFTSQQNVAQPTTNVEQPQPDNGTVTASPATTEPTEVYTVDNVKPKEKKHSTVWLWIVIALLAIAAGAMSFLYFDTKDDYDDVRSRNSSLQNEVYDIEKARNDAVDELSELKSTVSNAYPIVITDVEIANVYKDGTVETNYGSTIYDYNTMYLKPRIRYTGLTSGTKEFKVKWISPYGSLRDGASSPSGYSFAEDKYVNEGTDNTFTLSGWGNENRGNWSSGRYRLEIWYEDVCLKSVNVRIY